MSANVQLSLADASAARRVATMSRELIEHGLRWRWRPSAILRHIADPNSEVVIATDGNQLVGFVVARFFDAHVHLVLLAVAPPYRRLGLATRLMAWIESMASVAGTFEVRLEVRTSNRVARRFYEALGYRTVNRLVGYYEGRESAVRMARDLSGQPPRPSGAGGRSSEQLPR